MGFLALDGLADREGFRFNKLRFRAWTAQWKVGDQQVLVMKPQTYMNLSGESVGEAARFYKIPAAHVLVIATTCPCRPESCASGLGAAPEGTTG